MHMKYDRGKICSGLEESQIRSFAKNAIEAIQDIEAKIHRVSMSCANKNELYNYDYFKGKFGSECLVCINQEFDPKIRMPNYRQQIIVKCDGYTINIFIQPIDRFLPPYFMEVTPNDSMSMAEHKALFSNLQSMLPAMTISSVEYTLDLVCYDPIEVENLFMIIRRCLYAPYKTDTYFNGGSIATWGETIRINSVFSMNNIKVYERGFDNYKQPTGGWYNTDCNKVRLEYTAGSYDLRKNGITLLSDLLTDCCFYKMIKNKYKFKQFIGPRTLPLHYKWLSYTSEDGDGNFGAFHIEYLALKEGYENIRQYLRDIDELKDFKVRLLKTMVAFDEAWKSEDIIYIESV